MHKSAASEQGEIERLARQLAPTIQYCSKRFTSGLTPSPEASLKIRLDFYKTMAGFDRSMASALSRQVVDVFETADDMNRATDESGTEFQGQMERLSNILRHSDLSIRAYLSLAHLPEYPCYVFLSEQSPVTCERCLERHGALFALEDVVQDALPPLHLHCRCRLVAMDRQMADIYRRSSPRVLALLDQALDAGFGTMGGCFI